MIAKLAVAALFLADPLEHACQEPIYRDGGVVGMRTVDCEEPPLPKSGDPCPTPGNMFLNTYTGAWLRCDDRSRMWQAECDIGEVLAAARAVEPFLRREPCSWCASDLLPDTRTESQKMRDAADALDAEIAAIARLRAALTRCEEQDDPDDDGDQKNPPQKNMRSRP